MGETNQQVGHTTEKMIQCIHKYQFEYRSMQVR